MWRASLSTTSSESPIMLITQISQKRYYYLIYSDSIPKSIRVIRIILRIGDSDSVGASLSTIPSESPIKQFTRISQKRDYYLINGCCIPKGIRVIRVIRRIGDSDNVGASLSTTSSESRIKQITQISQIRHYALYIAIEYQSLSV